MSTSFFYRPAPPLSHFVATIWHYEGYTQPHALERLMPDGAMAMVVNLDEDAIRLYDRETHACVSSLRGTVITGAHDEFFIIDTAEQRCVLGVQFWPGGAYPFIDMPADQLRGEHFVIEGSLRERIIEARTPLARCRTMEAALLERARGRLELRPDIAAAVASMEHGGRVPDISKRFTERFRSTVGLTPKTYARVRRFQTTLRRIAQPGDIDWADIALACGYYDQAHFNHDFRAFSGINPSTYLAKKTPHLNHVPI